jgi:hypothetical protein
MQVLCCTLSTVRNILLDIAQCLKYKYIVLGIVQCLKSSVCHVIRSVIIDGYGLDEWIC